MSVRIDILVPEVSIHSPNEGRDRDHLAHISWILAFQSTLPMKGETFILFNKKRHPQVSIHSPNEGRDLMTTESAMDSLFQSTLPMKGETATSG